MGYVLPEWRRSSRHRPEEEGMSDFDWQWFIDRIGQPRPCALCRRPTPPRELRERWVTGAIIEVAPSCEIRPQKAVWLCPACPS